MYCLRHQNYKNENTETKYLSNMPKKKSFKGKELPSRIKKILIKKN